MKFIRILFPLIATLAFDFAFTSCEDTETYAELLEQENKYVNVYLANQRVINSIPADTVFETGKDAPFYRLDEDGNIYMQVVDAGTPGYMAEDNELLYLRFTRFDLTRYVYNESKGEYEFTYFEGNDEVLGGNYSFRFGNYELSSSYYFGMGVQKPLEFLPIDCQVNVVIKSQYGFPSEMSYVVPFLYTIRYYRPKN